jgi:hypothetical protein
MPGAGHSQRESVRADRQKSRVVTPKLLVSVAGVERAGLVGTQWSIPQDGSLLNH